MLPPVIGIQLLCRGKLITLENEKQVWISFKYERLPNLCYWCGRLTHDDKDYKTWIDSEGTLKLEDRQFGLRLRSPAFVLARKMGMIVSGYYTSRKKSESTTPPSPMDAEVNVNSDQPLMTLKERNRMLVRAKPTVIELANHSLLI